MSGLPVVLRFALGGLVAVAAPMAMVYAMAERQMPFRPGMVISVAGIDVDAGRELFEQNCAVCHGLTPAARPGAAPNLSEIGRTGGERRPGMDAVAYILESIVDPPAYRVPGVNSVMPPSLAASLSAGDVRNLVALLAGQGGEQVDLARIAALEVPPVAARPGEGAPVRREQVEHGLATFVGKGQCAGCHTLEPGVRYSTLKAPSLALAGYHEDDYLRESIREPSRVIVPGYEVTNVALADGRVLSGRLLRDDEAALTLLATDAQGNAELHVIARDEVETLDDEGTPAIQTTAVSPMPEGFGEILDAADVDSLLALFRSLN